MKNLWRIITFTKDLKKYYITVSLFSILVAATTQVVPLLTKAAIDEINKLTSGGVPSVTYVAILAGLVFLSDLLQTVFSNIGGFYGDVLASKQRRMLGSRYYDHVLKLPQSYFDKELSGKIINRMSRGIDQITNYTQTLSNNFLQFIFSALFSLIIVAHYAWPVAIMLAALYPIYIWLTTRSSAKWLAWQKQINENLDIASGRFAEGVSQIKVVKSFVREAVELSFYRRFMNKVVKTTAPQSKYWHKNDIFRRSVLAIINLAVYAFIFIQAARGDFSLGTLYVLIAFSQLIRIPLFSISFLVDQSQRAIANTKDYFEVIDEPVEQQDTVTTDLRIGDGAVRFQDVSFSYGKGAKVLKNISFEIQPGTKIALVGQSGEGKTTITNLLLGLYKADSGVISVDGQNTAEIGMASLRQSVAVVFQEPALFSGTVSENIAYGNISATADEIRAAAVAANADQFISKFDKAYDTQIGERGLRLSGGQKQRIAIARAILKDAPILILDEATSSLDSRSEHLVQDALERLMKGRTTIIIAHRLSTIRSVDQIVTLKGGRVDESGAPTELESSGGVYAELLELQNMLAGSNREKRLKAFDLAG